MRKRKIDSKLHFRCCWYKWYTKKQFKFIPCLVKKGEFQFLDHATWSTSPSSTQTYMIPLFLLKIVFNLAQGHHADIIYAIWIFKKIRKCNFPRNLCKAFSSSAKLCLYLCRFLPKTNQTTIKTKKEERKRDNDRNGGEFVSLHDRSGGGRAYLCHLLGLVHRPYST